MSRLKNLQNSQAPTPKGATSCSPNNGSAAFFIIFFGVYRKIQGITHKLPSAKKIRIFASVILSAGILPKNARLVQKKTKYLCVMPHLFFYSKINKNE
jgi:hypothetical protein